MDAKLTSEEYAQILQTIEMFEVISQAEPGDCQSYDILKEAYLKIGQIEAALQVSRKLAEAYLNMGLYSSALLECEGILQLAPNSPDIVALMGEIESRTAPQTGRNGSNGSHGSDFGLVSDVDEPKPSLIALQPNRGKPPGGKMVEVSREAAAAVNATDDGNEHFAKFLTFHRIVPESEVSAALERVHQANRRGGSQMLATSLLDEIARGGQQDIDQLLSSLIDATKFGYVPLEYYDIDRAVVRMLPENLTLGRLVVPFDIVSRTMMIALCNPFDAAAKQAVQSSLDYHIQWYLAKPSAIMRVLRDAYRLDGRD
jgi:tetratricopeptide (TPR) repeat protein